MALARYEPWDALNQLHRQINRIFDTQTAANAEVGSSATADWIPAADIVEYGDRFVLKFDVPGVNASAIDITLDQGVLTITGERPAEAVGNDVERSRRERPNGRFHRRFTLPDTVDAAAVNAKGRDGILEVTIPKQAKAKPRRIEVVTN
ncbi:HSP20 family protein [Povalibacter uvarum]|uniref:HSP20 family protein n=1 Tax=Povalibacter uvarum TaxID=732238 RepID=A0A841HJX1_9GAMM|nr:Hsp20/alpha crystallin family protein [Povalibacter uvarum]MBB6092325.1 HSP20 family protein [Povalibacter uvarum]